MTLRDLLKKKARIEEEQANNPSSSQPHASQAGASSSTTLGPPIPEFTFVRTTTNTEEVIAPPNFPGDSTNKPRQLAFPNSSLEPSTPTSSSKSKENERSRTRRISSLLHRSPPSTSSRSEHDLHARSVSNDLSSPPSAANPPFPGTDADLKQRKLSPTPSSAKRLSSRLHLPRTRSRSNTSTGVHSDNIPDDPLDAPVLTNGTDKATEAEAEARWEKRATLLVEGGVNGGAGARSRSGSSVGSVRSENGGSGDFAPENGGIGGLEIGGGGAGQDAALMSGARGPARPPMHERRISDMAGDINILEAIRLHESGDLPHSTAMFSKLADPLGANNALAQVLYALALRHGWGCPTDPLTAHTYLQRAASNSAAVEAAALQSGSAHGGAAKGELVLAIYELANCFRNGWGIEKDAVAARQYYETAANLGDVDAMGEVAWCYLTGFGGGKDKMRAAGYLRRKEGLGVKTVGDSWIWKGKYDPKP